MYKKCKNYTQDDLLPVERCPWKITRWSPRHRTLRYLFTFIKPRMSEKDSILEFGCGVSTWYLNQLNFKDYVACETFEDAIQKVENKCSNVNVVKRWEDIPVKKYKWIFIDSKAGSDITSKFSRYLSLTYAHERGFVDKNTIMVIHDYARIRKSNDNPNSIWASRMANWNKTIDEYDWKLLDEIMIYRGFGIYKRGKK